jgi:hypothetical protein
MLNAEITCLLTCDDDTRGLGEKDNERLGPNISWIEGELTVSRRGDEPIDICLQILRGCVS